MVPFSAIQRPPADPHVVFEIFRGSYGTELLTAAVAHFRVFEQLHDGGLPRETLRERIGLRERPFVVLLTGLKAFGLLTEREGRIGLTDLSRTHLLPGQPFDVCGYIGLAADSPGVKEMVERLRSNRPAGAEEKERGAAFIFREGLESAMERETSARHFTLALAGRAKNVAPVLAERVALPDAGILLDVGGGTGIYSIAFLQNYPQLRAIVLDRPEVLRLTSEFAETYGVADRLECLAADMFRDPLPKADIVLLSNVLHDWDVPECRALLQRCSDVMPSAGRLLIHDVFLNDALDGPLPIALYSAALFSFTEGRAYSAAEYRQWLSEVGLQPQGIIPTLIHCGVLPAVKS